MDILRVDIDGGRYTVLKQVGNVEKILYQGREWLGYIPMPSFVLAMANEIQELRKEAANVQRDVAGYPSGDDGPDSVRREPVVVGAVSRVLLPNGCFIDPRGVTDISVYESNGKFRVAVERNGRPPALVFESPCRMTSEDVARRIDAGSPLT